MVVRIEPDGGDRIDRLLARGLTPGATVKVLQTIPRVVFLCDQAELAVECVSLISFLSSQKTIGSVALINVGLCPTPRLGRLRGPLRPAPLPRRRAVRAYGRFCNVTRNFRLLPQGAARAVVFAHHSGFVAAPDAERKRPIADMRF